MSPTTVCRLGLFVIVNVVCAVQLYGQEEWQQLVRWPVVRQPSCLAISADGRLVASADGTETVKVWDDSTKARANNLVHRIGVDCVCFAPDADVVLATCGRTEWRTSPSGFGQVSLWHAATGEKLHDFTFYGRGVENALFTRDGAKVVAVIGGNRELVVLDVASKRKSEPLRDDHDRTVVNVNRVQAVGGKSAFVSIVGTEVSYWDSSGRYVDSVTIEGAKVRIAVSPDGGRFGVCSVVPPVQKGRRTQTTISACELRDSNRPRTVEVDGDFSDIEFTPDGDTICISGESADARMLDFRTLKETSVLAEARRPVSFSADGSTAISYSADRQIVVWRRIEKRK